MSDESISSCARVRDLDRSISTLCRIREKLQVATGKSEAPLRGLKPQSNREWSLVTKVIVPQGGDSMKWVYVAHPLRGDHPDDLKAIGENYDRVARICRRIAKEHDDILILSPLNAFSFFSPFEDQAQVLGMCLELLGVSDELWVYGDWRKSKGCCKEVAYAGLYGIQTRFPEEKPCSD